MNRAQRRAQKKEPTRPDAPVVLRLTVHLVNDHYEADVWTGNPLLIDFDLLATTLEQNARDLRAQHR